MILTLREQTEDLMQLSHPMSPHFSEGLVRTRLAGNWMYMLGTCHLLAHELPTPGFF